MAEFDDISEPIQLLMDKVKKNISKNNSYNKEIINSLFNLLDYQITLVNQINLFKKNNKEGGNNINYLININKDILVSMINKFLSKINSLCNNKGNVNEKNKYNITNKVNNFHKNVKLLNIISNINNNHNNYMNNNDLITNSSSRYRSPTKKSMEKEFNSAITLTQQSSLKKIEQIYESERNSYKFLKNKNIEYNLKNKNNKNIYDKLYYNKNYKCDHEEKKKNKIFLYQTCSKSMKDLYVDLNDNHVKNLFNKNFNSIKTISGKKTKKDDEE